MSILYIGPYRQNDYIGLESSVYLKSIHQSASNKNINLYTRPYYTRYDVNINNSDYSNLENFSESFTFPKTLIQHAKIEHLSIQPSNTNIVIPIIFNTLFKTSKYSILQKLNYCDHIIVNDEEDKRFLIKSDIIKPIHIGDIDILNYITDLNLLNSYYNYEEINKKYNFMFIGEYDANIEIIHTLIFAFTSAFRSDLNVALTLVIRGNNQNKQDLEKFCQKLLQQLKIVNQPEIRLHFSELTLQDIFAALNSADCLLSFNQDYNQKLYSNYIISRNKLCLSFKNTDYYTNLNSNPIYEYAIYDMIKTVNINSLVENFIKAKNSKIDKKKKNNDSVGKIICNLIS